MTPARWYVTKDEEPAGWLGGGQCARLVGPCEECDEDFSQPLGGEGMYVEDECPECFWHNLFEEGCIPL